MRQPKDWTKIWHNTRLDVGLLQAFYVHHAYPRHSHDYYVICVIERGLQSFTHRGTKHITPPGGLILLNPGAVHTGEPAAEQGFQMRSLYPTTAHMQTAVFELTGRHQALPFFKEVRVDHRWAMDSVLALHKALAEGASMLEYESRFTSSEVRTRDIRLIGDTPREVFASERLTLHDSRLRIGAEYQPMASFAVRGGVGRLGDSDLGGVRPSAGFMVEQALGSLLARAEYAFVLEPFALGTIHLITIRFFL